ncbi:hypothetical protein EB796_019135 [Bugula neritina]|uniref:Uncharacterized protein n=1 Tax=Bugula neritina TaxID=10212 RepID=A0A7J7JA54_BUGNE|nr:hypothetical protein EB796_019135 [Bugula neritina]
MSLFALTDLLGTYFDCKELTVKELDLVLTAKLQALMNWDFNIVPNKKVLKQRVYSHTVYKHHGKQVVNSSAVNNTALIVGDGTRDTEEVIMYDWAQFLPQFFRRLPHILTYHQIVLTAEGVAHCKKLVGESATTEILLKSILLLIYFQLQFHQKVLTFKGSGISMSRSGSFVSQILKILFALDHLFLSLKQMQLGHPTLILQLYNQLHQQERRLKGDEGKKIVMIEYHIRRF